MEEILEVSYFITDQGLLVLERTFWSSFVEIPASIFLMEHHNLFTKTIIILRGQKDKRTRKSSFWGDRLKRFFTEDQKI